MRLKFTTFVLSVTGLVIASGDALAEQITFVSQGGAYQPPLNRRRRKPDQFAQFVGGQPIVGQKDVQQLGVDMIHSILCYRFCGAVLHFFA